MVSNLGWTVGEPENRDFVGRDALQIRRNELDEKLVGLILIGKGVLRHGQRVLTDHGEGVITSGSFSCGLQYRRRVQVARERCRVEIRDKIGAVVVKPPL